MAGHEPLQKFIEGTQLDHASPTLVTATIILTVRDQLVRCDTTAVAGYTIYLPNVSEAIGKIYSITLTADGGDLVIADQDESYDWEGDYSITAAKGNALFYSDGYKWHDIAAHLT